MTSLAANVASLATGFGAVTGNVARLVAIVAALHRKAAGIVAALRAATRHVTSLVAIVTTQLRSLSRKILAMQSICRNLSRTGVAHDALGEGQIADGITNLLTVFRNVTNTIAAIAKILILLALACEMSKLVAFEALLSASSEASVPVAPAISSASTAALWALPCKVAHTVTFVTCA